jgi:hypothetical protein
MGERGSTPGEVEEGFGKENILDGLPRPVVNELPALHYFAGGGAKVQGGPDLVTQVQEDASRPSVCPLAQHVAAQKIFPLLDLQVLLLNKLFLFCTTQTVSWPEKKM